MTPSVRAAQADMGADQIWLGDHDRPSDRFTENEVAFIEQRDSFYIASVSETGWPYVQHRGGAPGFLKVIDDQTLAFADYRGNRQYISTGNFEENDRACLFLMDYPRRARLKMYGHVERLALDADPALTERVQDTGYKAKIERIFKIRLEAYDWNCPQHITPATHSRRSSRRLIRCGNDWLSWKRRMQFCAHGWRAMKNDGCSATTPGSMMRGGFCCPQGLRSPWDGHSHFADFNRSFLTVIIPVRYSAEWPRSARSIVSFALSDPGFA